MSLAQGLRLANVAACALACCLLAPAATMGQWLSFPKEDEIKTASGTLRRGAIIDLTAEQVLFQTSGEASPVRWPRESLTIVRWAGVTDAPQRVSQSRGVFTAASSTLGNLAGAPGADLGSLAQKVDDALSCLEVIHPVATDPFNNQDSVNEANALSGKLKIVAAELARVRAAQPSILRCLDLVQRAKAAIQKGGLASASAFLADARRDLGAVEPVIRKRFGLESLPEDLAAAAATLAGLNGAVLEDRVVPKTLSDLEPLRDLVAASMKHMNSGLPICVAPLEWQETVRRRLQARAEAVAGALRQTEVIRTTVINIERQLALLASRADTKDDAWQPLAAQVEADFAAASNVKVAPDVAPLVLATLADLRQRFERVKTFGAVRAMAGHISRVSETDARLLAAYQQLLANLGDGASQETLKSTREGVAAIKKDLAAHEEDLRAVPDVKGAAADALQALRATAQGTRQKVDRLEELIDLGEGIFKARAALEDEGEAVSKIGENTKRIQDRLTALRAERDMALASLVDGMADQVRQTLRRVEYVAGCREAERLQASIETKISAGQLDEARAEQQKHREWVRRIQELDAEPGGAHVSEFQSQQRRLAAQLDRAIMARRKQAGWLEPFPTEPELVPPLMWNRWGVVWLAMGGGRGSGAEAALAALKQSPESDRKEWAARLAEARAFICLRRGIEALDLRDSPEARRFFKEGVAEAPASSAAKAAQVELIRLDEAEWRAASRQMQRQALLAATGALAVLVPLVGAVVWSRRPPRQRRKAARLLAMATAAASQGNGRQVAVRVARAQRILKRLRTDTAEDADLRLKAARLLEVKPRDLRKEIRQRIDDSGDEAEWVRRIAAGTSYRPEAVELCLNWLRKHPAHGSKGAAGPAVQVRNWLVAALAASPGEGAAGASWREPQAEQAVEIVATSPDLWLCLADNARALSHHEKAQTAYRSALPHCRDGDRALRAVIGLARTFLDQGRSVEAARLLRGVQRKQLVLPDVPPADATVLHDELVRENAMPEIRLWHGVAIGTALKDGRVQNPAAARAALPMLFPEEES